MVLNHRVSSQLHITHICCNLAASDYAWRARQALFLSSSQPSAAVALRAGLRHWPEALALAEHHDPGALASLCCHHGQVHFLLHDLNYF